MSLKEQTKPYFPLYLNVSLSQQDKTALYTVSLFFFSLNYKCQMPSRCGDWWLIRFNLPCWFLSSLWLWENCNACCNYFGTQNCCVLYALYSNTFSCTFCCEQDLPYLAATSFLNPTLPSAFKEASLKLSADNLLNVLIGCVIQKKLALELEFVSVETYVSE